MILTHPQLKEWNDYYPCPSGIERLGLKLINPNLYVEDRGALGHDFYYLSDEYTVIFQPLETKTEVHMLVEGPHIEPQGERIPILSTWSHLKRGRGDTIPGAVQHNFAFYNGKWWVAELTYDYSYEYKGHERQNNIDVVAYSPLYWCACDRGDRFDEFGNPNWRFTNSNETILNGHGIYSSYDRYTIFKDKTRTDFSVMFDHVRENFCDMPILADWLEERGDLFSEYVRGMAIGRGWEVAVLPELSHMCASIKAANNDRAAKLQLLAQGIQKNYFRWRLLI
jgi:hypothetical protein